MKQLTQLVLVTLLGLFFTGCSLTYDLNPPISSSGKYESAGQKQKVVYVVDKRQDKKFIRGMTGLQSVDLTIGNVEEPIAWLAQNLEKEFLSHEISVQFTLDAAMKDSADAILTVNRFQIINSRTSGFHPYVAYHSFSGTVHDSEASETVISYFVYGKTPVWSMTEVQEPCFDMPSAILIKGIAAKVNRTALHYQMSDSQLAMLNEKAQESIKTVSPDAYLAVLELGESNNPKAVDYLKSFAENSDTLIRACALSAIGMIGQEDTFEYLKEEYDQHVDIDRFMALKSIGDLGTPESTKFLKDARLDPQYNDEYGFKFVVDLYLDSLQ